MKFKLDANVGVRGRQILVNAGHDVVTAAEQGLAGAPDDVLANACLHERRALITLDTDFANPFVYPPAAYAGIVVMRIPSKGTVSDVEAALRGLLGSGRVDKLAGHLFVVDHLGRVRVYQRDPTP